jgi:hypothetical protein
LEEKWEVWKRNLKDERMKEGESGAGIRVQMRMRMKKQMKDDVELNEVRVAINDMMERKECSSRKIGLERLWRSRRWRSMRKLESEEKGKTKECHGKRSKGEEDRTGE